MSTSNKVRVLLAEDHVLVREGLRRLIDEQDDMEVIAEASDGAEAVRLCAEMRPTVALVDISMPVVDGVRVTAELSEQCPEVRTIALTRHDDYSFVTKVLTAGASGYVLKQNASTELARAVRAVVSGERYIDASVRARHPDSPAPARPRHPAVALQPLSPLEEQVLRLVAQSFSNQEIATRLGLDVAAIAEQKTATMRRLGLLSRLDAIRYASEAGWDRG